MQITAVTVVGPLTAQCFCNGLHLAAIESTKAAQVALKGTTQIAQIVKQRVPGRAELIIILPAAAAACNHTFKAVQEASAGFTSCWFQELAAFRVGDHRREAGTYDAVQQPANYVTGYAWRNLNQDRATVTQRKRIFQRGQKVFIQTVLTTGQQGQRDFVAVQSFLQFLNPRRTRSFPVS